MPDTPPPDLILFVAAALGAQPTEIARFEYAHFTTTALSVRLADGAAPGTAEALREKLAAAFPGLTVAVLG